MHRSGPVLGGRVVTVLRNMRSIGMRNTASGLAAYLRLRTHQQHGLVRSQYSTDLQQCLGVRGVCSCGLPGPLSRRLHFTCHPSCGRRLRCLSIRLLTVNLWANKGQNRRPCDTPLGCNMSHEEDYSLLELRTKYHGPDSQRGARVFHR